MKTYVISGAAQGIGLRLALDLLELKARVAIIDVKPMPEEFTAALKAQNLIYLEGSSADEAAVKDLMHKVGEKWGHLSGLINNSGIMIRKPVTELTYEEWRRVIDTNLTSAFLLSREAIPLLKKSKGSILNISSTRAHQSEPNTESYAATKGGLLALTHALAISLGPDIRVNCISPGWIDSRSPSEQKKEPLKESDHKQHPAGRVGRTEDISELVQWLLSDKSSFVTGQEFVIDGGMTKKMIYVD